MKNLTPVRLDQIAACRSDLLASDVDLAHLDAAALAALVRGDLEYFQMMLRDESTPRQVLDLIRRDLHAHGDADRPLPAPRRPLILH